MDLDIAIRPYRPDDLEGFVAVVRDLQRHEGALYDRMLPAEAIGGWYAEIRLRECAEAGGVMLVAELDGAVAGYATLLLTVSSVEDQDEADYLYAYIQDLGVAAGLRGRGIGTALIAACEERARRAGRQWLRISVLAANADAERLYRREGFEPHILTLEKPLAS